MLWMSGCVNEFMSSFYISLRAIFLCVIAIPQVAGPQLAG